MSYCDGCATRDKHVDSLYVALGEARAENERLRKLVVWCVKHGAMEDEHSRLVLTWFVDEDYYASQHDGTDADLFRALVEAMGGE